MIIFIIRNSIPDADILVIETINGNSEKNNFTRKQ